MRALHHLRNLSAVLIGSLVGSCAIGQTYYYVDHISVTPPSPTTTDEIAITLTGSLSNTASYIVGTGFNVVGNTVELNVTAAVDGIGLDVLVPHSESFNIGTLAAGTYTIDVSGTSILDMAPQAEHQFSVSGGGATACDSLSLLGARWSMFSDTSIVLTVANASADLFDYPGFVLLDLEGDTIASEVVNYFGIGTEPQDHLLTLHSGALTEGAAVEGELHLWSGFYTEQECTWPVTWELCPAQECFNVTPYLWNMGDGLVAATVPYTLEDDNDQVLSSGTFTLTPNDQNAHGQEICLPPGSYTLRLEQVGFVGGQLFYGLSTPPMNSEMTSSPYVQGTAENAADITLLERCVDLPNSLPEPGMTPPHLEVITSGDRIIISATDQRPLGRLHLVDASGRTMATVYTQSDRYVWFLPGLPGGVYMVHGARTTAAPYGAVRFVR